MAVELVDRYGMVATMSDRVTYTVRTERSDGWWAIIMPQLRGVHSQARRLDLVPAAARDAIAAMLDVEPDSFDVKHH